MPGGSESQAVAQDAAFALTLGSGCIDVYLVVSSAYRVLISLSLVLIHGSNRRTIVADVLDAAGKLVKHLLAVFPDVTSIGGVDCDCVHMFRSDLIEKSFFGRYVGGYNCGNGLQLLNLPERCKRMSM
jgi:hypothetical protein